VQPSTKTVQVAGHSVVRPQPLDASGSRALGARVADIGHGMEQARVVGRHLHHNHGAKRLLGHQVGIGHLLGPDRLRRAIRIVAQRLVDQVNARPAPRARSADHGAAPQDPLVVLVALPLVKRHKQPAAMRIAGDVQHRGPEPGLVLMVRIDRVAHSDRRSPGPLVRVQAVLGNPRQQMCLVRVHGRRRDPCRSRPFHPRTRLGGCRYRVLVLLLVRLLNRHGDQSPTVRVIETSDVWRIAPTAGASDKRPVIVEFVLPCRHTCESINQPPNQSTNHGRGCCKQYTQPRT